MPSPTDLVLDQDHYYYVNLGRKDFANGPARYGFPTLGAAERFADAQHELDPRREIWIG